MEFLKESKLVEEIEKLNSKQFQGNLKTTIELLDKEKGTIDNPYRPTANTIKKYKTNIIGKTKDIMFFSPYRVEVSHMKKGDVFTRLFSKHFGINKEKIGRLETQTKLEIIKAGIEGIKKMFYENRSGLLYHDEMFEDDYEEHRLDYLLKHERNLKSKPEELYQKLEKEFLTVVEKALLIYFKVEDKGNKKYNLSLYNRTDDLLTDYRLNCLTFVENMNSFHFYGLMQSFFHKEFLVAKNDLLIDLYPNLKVKLITYNILSKNIKTDEIKLNDEGFNRIYYIILNFNYYEKLLDVEELEVILNGISWALMECHRALKIGDRSYLNKYSRRTYQFTKSIPMIVKALEKKNNETK